jgi:hypothetical protein
MLLTVDSESKRITATIQNSGRIEKYESIISGCENPVCTCETVYLDLIPAEVKDDNKEQLTHRRAEIDIAKKSLGFKNKISEEASPDSIDGYFEYHEVEYDGLMSAYNDVLPYGDQLLVTIGGKERVESRDPQ